MNIICLLDTPEAVLATGKRVFDASETGALLSLVESADRLQAGAQGVEDRIAQAESEARARGREDGIAQGREVAKAELAQTTIMLVEQANAERALVREDVVSLALQVVRKVANGVASEDMLYALANTAAQECLSAQSIVLKVHPTEVDAVKNRLAQHQANGDSIPPIHNVIADEDLALDACVLETDAGQVCADLDMQLGVLEKHLSGSKEITVNVSADSLINDSADSAIDSMVEASTDLPVNSVVSATAESLVYSEVDVPSEAPPAAASE